jgi:hypothetical protein
MSNPVEHLKKLAKGLLKSARAIEPAACARFRAVYSDYREVSDADLAGQVSLGRAQHVIAVEHEFKSWDVLTTKRPIEIYLAITLAKEPTLNDAGMGLSSTDRAKSREERVAAFQQGRRQIWERIDAIEMAVVWLKEKVKPTKRMNPRRSSYGTKHVAEPDIGYISNGAWIAALLIAGFDIKIHWDSLNTDVALSERSLRAIEDERQENPRPYGWRRSELRSRLGLPPLPRNQPAH